MNSLGKNVIDRILSFSLTYETGLYVSVHPVATPDLKRVFEFCKENLPELPLYSFEEFHCTLIYSRGVCPELDKVEKFKNTDILFKATCDECEAYPGHDKDGYLVLLLKCPSLEIRHKEWRKLGASHSFDEYKCHMTLASKFDLNTKEVKRAIDLLSTYLHNAPLNIVLTYETVAPIKG